MPKFIVLTKSVVEADSLTDAIQKVRAQKKSPVVSFNQTEGAHVTEDGVKILNMIRAKAAAATM